MAIDFAGMFTDPNSFRDQRLQDLMQQRAGISQMGGSMNQLLGQVAAGGGATGAQLAEGLGGMFGLKTREEAQAQKVQDMAGMIDMNDPEDLNQFAKALNSMGMTKEAVMVLDKRQRVIEQGRETEKFADYQADTKLSLEQKEMLIAAGRLKKGPPTYERIPEMKNGKPTGGYRLQEKEQWLIYDDESKRFVPYKGNVTSESGSATGSYGGITVIDPKTGMATMTEGDPAVDGYKEDFTISP